MNQLICNQFLMYRRKTLSLWSFRKIMGGSKPTTAMKSYEEIRRDYGKKHFQIVSQPTGVLRLQTLSSLQPLERSWPLPSLPTEAFPSSQQFHTMSPPVMHSWALACRKWQVLPTFGCCSSSTTDKKPKENNRAASEHGRWEQHSRSWRSSTRQLGEYQK